MRQINWDKCPEKFRQGLKNYVEAHIRPGSFLTAVLKNNLSEALAKADEESAQLLPTLVSFLINELPDSMWASDQAFQVHIQQGKANAIRD